MYKTKLIGKASLAGVLAGFFLLASIASAAPVDADQARQAARGWLRKYPAPLDTPMPSAPAETQTVYDETGQPLYHITNLAPEGFVILSADDEIDPVIAFSAAGQYDPTADSPLKTLLHKDMSARLRAVAQKQDGAAQRDGTPQHQRPRDRASQQWDDLLTAADMPAPAPGDPAAASIPSSVSDVRVDPFLPTRWGQDEAAGGYCYNYYTPNHYPTGCVATAMAQLMRHHAWPTTGIGVKNFSIRVNGATYYYNTLGGNGSGGAYNWAQMPYLPDNGLTETQRQAIGALCFDAGLSVNMSYTSDSSAATLYAAHTQLVDTFKYGNCIYGRPASVGADFQAMVNSNLDAALPVILGIDGPNGGHAVIADGYGYQNETAYHHISMGWGGMDDTWYQLPLIDASYTFNVVDDCLYNIYPSGTGEIISGRVTTKGGAPLAGALVTAWRGGTQAGQTTTDSRGIYALTNLASSAQHRLSVSLAGYSFTNRYATTGRSQDYGSSTGNQWAVDIAAANASPPVAQDLTVDVPATDPTLIALDALDDNLPDPALFTYTITSLPAHGDLSDPGVGPITAVPYTLTATENKVLFNPCPYFNGTDTFTYKANDGGTPPTGGDSNIAAVTVNVVPGNPVNLDYGADSSTYLNGGMILQTEAYTTARSEIILLQSEIGGPRYLTDLAIKVYQVPGRTLSNWTIRMQHTNWTWFNNPNSMIPTGGWTTVYQSDVTVTSTGWINFHFERPFYYNGTQNLLIDLSFSNTGRTSPDGKYYITVASEDRVLSLGTDSTSYGDPLNWDDWYGKYAGTSSYIPSVKLLGTADWHTPLAGDIDLSCDVGMPDFTLFSQAWMTSLGHPDYNPDCDLATPKNNTINLPDLAVLINNWFSVY